MSIGTPSSSADGLDEQPKTYTKADMLNRLFVASKRLNVDMKVYEAKRTADSLVEKGVLSTQTIGPLGSPLWRQNLYYVPNANEYSPDPHTNTVLVFDEYRSNENSSWQPTSVEMILRNRKGFIAARIKKDTQGNVYERASAEFHPNDNPKVTTSSYPSASSRKAGVTTHVRMFNEDDPNNPIFHQITDSSTGTVETLIDNRPGKSRQPESDDGLKERH